MTAVPQGEKVKEEVEKPQNLILHTLRNSMQHQEPDDLPTLSADKVATSLKRQESAETTTPPEAEPKAMTEPIDTAGIMEKEKRENSPMAKLRHYPPYEGLNNLSEDGGKKDGVSRRLFTQEAAPEKEVVQESPPATPPGAKASPLTAAKPERMRRMKSVDKPVKALVLAGEEKESGPGGAGGDAGSKSWVQLRKVSHEELEKKKSDSATTSATNQPAWVAIAQVCIQAYPLSLSSLEIQHNRRPR